MFRCKLGKHVQTIELRGELQSGVQSFEAGRTERIRQVDSGVNCQTKLMQQDSHVMCVNGPVRTERVWWPMGKYIVGDSNSDGKGHLRNRRVIHYQSGTRRKRASSKSKSHPLPVRYSTVQYSTVQYSTVQYSTVQYSTVQYSTVQYSTVQYSTVQYSTVRLKISNSRTLLLCLHRIP